MNNPFSNAVMYSYYSENQDAVIHVVAPDRNIDWYEARIFYVETYDGQSIVEGGDMMSGMWDHVCWLAANCIDLPDRPPHEVE
jgi:hypothetical protein